MKFPLISHLYTLLLYNRFYESLNEKNGMCELSVHAFPNLVKHIWLYIYIGNLNAFLCTYSYILR